MATAPAGGGNVGIDGPEGWSLRRTQGPKFMYSFAPTHYYHEAVAAGVVYVTQARRRRKGRHPTVQPLPHLKEQMTIKHKRPRGVCAPFGYRLWGWEWDNISWWVAQFFTWGSVWWIINGIFAVWPLSDEKANKYIIGYFALAGGSFFLVGAYLAVVEVLNANRKLEFGHEVKHDLEKLEVTIVHHGAFRWNTKSQQQSDKQKASKVQSRRPVEHQNSKAQNGHKNEKEQQADGEVWNDGDEGVHFVGGPQPKWRWWGWEPRNFSFWTVFSQLMGATIFAIPACITGVPHVLPYSDYERYYLLWDLLYWLPQVIGATFFVISSYFQMVEVQGRWIGFKPFDLGWESSFWNLIGAIGFWLSGYFGFYQYPSGQYQLSGTAISTFWGSVAFLISSYILIPETLNP